MFNRSPFNAATFNGTGPGPTTVSDTETVGLSEGEVVGVSSAEQLWLNPESDSAGTSGTFNAFRFNGLPFNSARRVRGKDWVILARVSDAESTPEIAEDEQVIQAIVLNLGAPGSSWVLQGTLRLTWEVNKRARCTMRLAYPGDATSYYTPRPGHRIKILDFDGSTVLFHGSIEQVGNELMLSAGTKRLFVDVVAVGWEQIADRRLAVKSYTDEDLDVIVADLVDTYLAADGVTATGLPSGVTVDGDVIFSYKRVSDCFDELSRRTGYWWRIDASKNVVFYSPASAVAAPLTITATGTNYRSLKDSRDRSQYRNKQYLSNVWVTTSSRTESFVGDGAKRTFTLAYAAYSTPTVTLNGSAQTVGIKDVDSGKNWYWNKGSAELVQDQAGTLLTDSDALEVTYVGQYEMVRAVTDSAEVADRASIEGGSGVYELISGDGVALNTAASADAYAQALIDRNAPIPSVVSIESDDAGLTLPGMYVPITEPALQLSGNFFVRRVVAEILPGTEVIRRRIEATSNEPEEAWQQAFKKQQATKDLTQLPTNGV